MDQRCVRIALGDGDGCFSNVSFWEQFFRGIDCEFIDCVDDLTDLHDIDEMFPSIVCLNTKQRLSRASKLSKKNLTHILYFLRNDKSVHNCPSSVYRVQWLKEYWKRFGVQVVVWKEDLAPQMNDSHNLHLLADQLDRVSEFGNLALHELGVVNNHLPRREMAYDFSIIEGRKTLLLIGVSPHLIDPYRKSKTMDHLMSKYNIIFPHFITSHFQLPDKPECSLKLYKLEGIFEAIRMVMDREISVDGMIFNSDAFDIPGRFAFPVIKSRLNELGVYEFNDQCCPGKLGYLNLIISYQNQDQCIRKIEEFTSGI